jgi:hypothetical protein
MDGGNDEELNYRRSAGRGGPWNFWRARDGACKYFQRPYLRNNRDARRGRDDGGAYRGTHRANVRAGGCAGQVGAVMQLRSKKNEREKQRQQTDVAPIVGHHTGKNELRLERLYGQ